MERVFKGQSVNKHISDYCVLDLETTGVYISSARIIEVGILRVRDDEVVDKYDRLINPGCHIPEAASAVNHITDETVADALFMQDAIDDIIAFVGDDVIVGYNIAGFDMNLIYDACMDLRKSPFSNDYIDLLHAARRCLTTVENYKLQKICEYYGLDTSGEHRALKDCSLTKDCYDCLYGEFGDLMFKRRTRSGQSRKIQYSPETLALRELHNLIQDIMDDEKVTLFELTMLIKWMEEHVDLQGNYPFDHIFGALDKVLADGKVTADELDEMKDIFADFINPVKSRCCHDEITSIAGKHIIITGDFEYGNRNSVYALIEKAGGIIDKSVKKATNYVIVGSQGSDAWKTGNYGSKIQKAIELSEKGQDIKLVEESDFIPAVQKIIASGRLPGAVDWKRDIRQMFEQMIVEYELPEGSLYLSDNYGQKDKEKLISNTVYIWEPDYPPTKNMKPGKNKLVMTIYQKTYELEISIRDYQEGDLHEYLPCDAILMPQTKSDKDTNMVRVKIPDTSSNLVPYVKRHTDYCIKGYETKATRFGCCSLFNECSDAKRCIHENKLYSKACMYRDHLDNGRIFYGKNRNID